MHDRIVTPTVLLPAALLQSSCVPLGITESVRLRQVDAWHAGRAGAEIDVRIEPNPAAVDRPRRRHS